MNLGEVKRGWRLRSIQVHETPNEANNLLSEVNNTWRNIFGPTPHCLCSCGKSVLLVLDQELLNGLIRRSAVFWPGTFCCFSHELWLLLVWAISARFFISPKSSRNAFSNSVVLMFPFYSCGRSLQHWPWALGCVWVSPCHCACPIAHPQVKQSSAPSWKDSETSHSLRFYCFPAGATSFPSVCLQLKVSELQSGIIKNFHFLIFTIATTTTAHCDVFPEHILGITDLSLF